MRFHPFERIEGGLRLLDGFGLSLAMSRWILEAFVRSNDLLHVCLPSSSCTFIMLSPSPKIWRSMDSLILTLKYSLAAKLPLVVTLEPSCVPKTSRNTISAVDVLKMQRAIQVEINDVECHYVARVRWTCCLDLHLTIY